MSVPLQTLECEQDEGTASMRMLGLHQTRAGRAPPSRALCCKHADAGISTPQAGRCLAPALAVCSAEHCARWTGK